MDGGAVLVEQAGPRERIAAGAERAEPHAALGETPQRREQRRRHGLAHADAAADEEDLGLARLVERDGRPEVEPAARRGRAAVERRDAPLVDVAAGDAVRHAQRLQRVCDRDQGVVRQRQEGIPALQHAARVCHRRARGCLIPTRPGRIQG